MLKQITIILLLCAFFCNTFSNLFIWADYYHNTQKFSASCINKSKPVMHCNGKCQVNKKIEHEQTKDRQNPENKTELNSSILSSKSFFAELPAMHSVPFTATYFVTEQRKCKGQPASVFHPPCIYI